MDVAVGSVLSGNLMTLSYPSMLSCPTDFCVRESDLPDFVLDAARLTLVPVFEADDELGVRAVVSAPL